MANNDPNNINPNAANPNLNTAPGAAPADIHSIVEENVKAETAVKNLKKRFEEYKQILNLFNQDLKTLNEEQKKQLIGIESIDTWTKKLNDTNERYIKQSLEINKLIGEANKKYFDISAITKEFSDKLQKEMELTKQFSDLSVDVLETNFSKIADLNGQIRGSLNEFEEAKKRLSDISGIDFDDSVESYEKLLQRLEQLESSFQVDVSGLDVIPGQTQAAMAAINRITEFARDKVELDAGSIGNIIDGVFTNQEEAVQNILDQYDQLVKKQQEITDLRVIAGQEEAKAQIQTLEAANKEIAAIVAVGNAKQLQIKYTQQLKEETISLSKAMTNLNDVAGVFKKTSDLIGSSILAMTAYTGNFKKSFGDAAKSISSGLIDAFLSPKASLENLSSLFTKFVINSTFEYDKLISDINKRTGGFGKEFEKIAYNSDKMFAFPQLAKYGIGVKEIGDAYAGLNSSVANFNNLTEQQKASLTVNAAKLSNLGLSASEYGQLVNKFMGGIGKTAAGAEVEINKLAADAIAAGKSVSEYANSFKSVSASITGFGREARQIFKELEGMARAFGAVTAQDLVSISEAFSTFDGAADSTAKLSAALGGVGINMMEIMRADPSEKIIKIKEAYMRSGKDFDQLNIGYKRAIAEAMGLGKDVEKAGSMLRKDMGETMLEMHRTAASEKEIEERKKRSADAQERINKAIDNMKIALAPAIEKIAELTDKFINFTDSIGQKKTLLVGTLIAGSALIGTIIKSTFQYLGNAIASSISKGTAEATKSIDKLRKSLSSVRAEMQGLSETSGATPKAPGDKIGKSAATAASTIPRKDCVSICKDSISDLANAPETIGGPKEKGSKGPRPDINRPPKTPQNKRGITKLFGKLMTGMGKLMSVFTKFLPFLGVAFAAYEIFTTKGKQTARSENPEGSGTGFEDPRIEVRPVKDSVTTPSGNVQAYKEGELRSVNASQKAVNAIASGERFFMDPKSGVMLKPSPKDSIVTTTNPEQIVPGMQTSIVNNNTQQTSTNKNLLSQLNYGDMLSRYSSANTDFSSNQQTNLANNLAYSYNQPVSANNRSTAFLSNSNLSNSMFSYSNPNSNITKKQSTVFISPSTNSSNYTDVMTNNYSSATNNSGYSVVPTKQSSTKNVESFSNITNTTNERSSEKTTTGVSIDSLKELFADLGTKITDGIKNPPPVVVKVDQREIAWAAAEGMRSRV